MRNAKLDFARYARHPNDDGIIIDGDFSVLPTVVSPDSSIKAVFMDTSRYTKKFDLTLIERGEGLQQFNIGRHKQGVFMSIERFLQRIAEAADVSLLAWRLHTGSPNYEGIFGGLYHLDNRTKKEIATSCTNLDGAGMLYLAGKISRRQQWIHVSHNGLDNDTRKRKQVVLLERSKRMTSGSLNVGQTVFFATTQLDKYFLHGPPELAPRINVVARYTRK